MERAPLPEIGKMYKCYKGSLVSKGTVYDVTVVCIHFVTNLPTDLRELYEQVLEQDNHSFWVETDYVIEAISYKDLNNPAWTCFSRNKHGEWYSWEVPGNHRECGELDVDGSLTRGYKMVVDKYWIRGRADKPEEVIKALEKVGGKNVDYLTGEVESLVYFIREDSGIGCINLQDALPIMMNGIELRVSDETEIQKGDLVRFKEGAMHEIGPEETRVKRIFTVWNWDEGLDITYVELENFVGAYRISDVVRAGLIKGREPKDNEPVMVSDTGTTWSIRLYALNGETHSDFGDKTFTWKYIVPWSEFDFKIDPIRNIEKSIV